MKYVRNNKPGSVFLKGKVYPGDEVPRAVARCSPDLFDVVDPTAVVTPPSVVIASSASADVPEEAPVLCPVLPDYDNLNVRMVLQEAALMSSEDVQTLYDWEQQNKGRRTVLRDLSDMLAAFSSSDLPDTPDF